MSSVIQILNCDDINTILNMDNIVRCSEEPYHNGKSRIYINSLSYCVSLHDLPMVYEKEDLLNFIEKYKRRFFRIIDHIKSDNKICFIRFSEINNIQQNKFIDTILKINPHCDFKLAVINKKCSINNIIKQDKYIQIDVIDDGSKYVDWTYSHIDWEDIFSKIDKCM